MGSDDVASIRIIDHESDKKRFFAYEWRSDTAEASFVAFVQNFRSASRSFLIGDNNNYNANAATAATSMERKEKSFFDSLMLSLLTCCGLLVLSWQFLFKSMKKKENKGKKNENN